jgi:hypothetical protein
MSGLCKKTGFWRGVGSGFGEVVEHVEQADGVSGGRCVKRIGKCFDLRWIQVNQSKSKLDEGWDSGLATAFAPFRKRRSSGALQNASVGSGTFWFGVIEGVRVNPGESDRWKGSRWTGACLPDRSCGGNRTRNRVIRTVIGRSDRLGSRFLCRYSCHSETNRSKPSTSA